jgi:hypothetical protein
MKSVRLTTLRLSAYARSWMRKASPEKWKSSRSRPKTKRASEEEANQLRSETAQAGSQAVMGVERCEIAISPERS